MSGPHHRWDGGFECLNPGCTRERRAGTSGWRFRDAGEAWTGLTGVCLGEGATSRANPPLPAAGSTSVAFRLPRRLSDELKDLVKSTRIRKAEYVREALEDLLKKHEKAT